MSASSQQLPLTPTACPACRRQRLKPSHPGTSLADSRYLDSEDIGGTLLEQFKGSFAFIRRNLHHVQRGRSFNTLGELEIPETALEELLVNALSTATISPVPPSAFWYLPTGWRLPAPATYPTA